MSAEAQQAWPVRPGDSARGRFPRVRAIVTDVDNTLFDWVHAWAVAFQAMLDVLAPGGEADRAWWCDTFQALHESRGTTECPDALEHLAPALAAARPRVEASTLAQAALAYRRAWCDHLVPFEGMHEALRRLAARGVTVVALTESDASLTAVRLARLGMSGVVRTVYGPRTACFPRDARVSLALSAPAGVAPAAVRMLPRECAKPSPDALRIVLDHLGVRPGEAIYVGDHLLKDMGMARKAGVASAWAEFGTKRDPRETALHERVAHWRSADVAHERALDATEIAPTWRLRHASELLTIVTSAPAEV